uniref:Uncharacterized protein n=1 Tax=Chromera velia CCMP2878 TaxID=1169474 RepID=A0A0G4GC27_9ALVE|eukprot:Cvel_21246.t1-p1 / transcript=Cvel_21246.t1 / gene=Cvel_21246 / organism=Chromera_velia_CCMP2878 / gene_product=hypothetical protein / transcript_product=hypothetical protein / location=Cvel_scaffold1976:19314-22527(-) / protein_length=501 / sequence_SO=supercontig / SO=protein_coding / is_pseudo=false
MDDEGSIFLPQESAQRPSSGNRRGSSGSVQQGGRLQDSDTQIIASLGQSQQETQVGGDLNVPGGGFTDGDAQGYPQSERQSTENFDGPLPLSGDGGDEGGEASSPSVQMEMHIADAEIPHRPTQQPTTQQRHQQRSSRPPMAHRGQIPDALPSASYPSDISSDVASVTEHEEEVVAQRVDEALRENGAGAGWKALSAGLGGGGAKAPPPQPPSVSAPPRGVMSDEDFLEEVLRNAEAKSAMEAVNEGGASRVIYHSAPTPGTGQPVPLWAQAPPTYVSSSFAAAREEPFPPQPQQQPVYPSGEMEIETGPVKGPLVPRGQFSAFVCSREEAEEQQRKASEALRRELETARGDRDAVVVEGAFVAEAAVCVYVGVHDHIPESERKWVPMETYKGEVLVEEPGSLGSVVTQYAVIPRGRQSVGEERQKGWVNSQGQTALESHYAEVQEDEKPDYVDRTFDGGLVRLPRSVGEYTGAVAFREPDPTEPPPEKNGFLATVFKALT